MRSLIRSTLACLAAIPVLLLASTSHAARTQSIERVFAAAFPAREGEVSLFTQTRALGAFQRTLISADSSYDRYKYAGVGAALPSAGKRGEELFFSEKTECHHCHQGFNFTDTFRTARSGFDEHAFHNTGLYDVDGADSYPSIDQGLYAICTDARDRGRFRTLSYTAPYLHDGSAASLDDVLDHYAAGGRTVVAGADAGVGADSPLKNPLVLGMTLDNNERADLIAFLKSLDEPGFVVNPAFSDPWPVGHPASISQREPSANDRSAERRALLPALVASALAALFLVALRRSRSRNQSISNRNALT